MKRAQVELLGGEVVVRILVGVFLFFVVISIISKCFEGPTEQARKSYESFTEMLKIIEKGEVRSQILTADTGAVILAFSKDAKELKSVDRSEYPYSYFFTRPSICEEGKSCFCLCPDMGFEGNQLTCDKALACSSLNTVDFPSEWRYAESYSDAMKRGYPYTLEGQGSETRLEKTYVEGGYLFVSLPFSAGKAYQSSYPIFSDRHVSLTAERKGSEIRLCFKQPCYPVPESESPKTST